MAADQIEELIMEIAAKHGVAVGRNDPILVLQTINNRLMEDSARAQQAMLDQFKSELEGIAQRWEGSSKNSAEKVLNASLAASKAGMVRSMEEGALVTAAAVRAEITAIVDRVAEQIADSRRLARLNLIASALTVVAACVALWATLG